MARFAVLAAALAISTPPPAFPQVSTSDAPLSAGSVALLVEQAHQESERSRLRLALSDPRGPVRAAAARVIHAAGVVPLVPDAWTALAREEDPVAASELARAAIVLGQELDVGTLQRAVGLGPTPAAAVADALGRTRGHETPIIPALREHHVLGTYLRASAWDPAASTLVAVAILRDGAVDEWRELLALDRAVDIRLPLDEGMIRSGLTHSVSGLRAETLWHLVVRISRGEEVSSRTRSDLDGVLSESQSDPTRDEESFAKAIVRRLLGRGRRDVDWEEWLLTGAEEELLVRVAETLTLRRVLRKSELQALGRRLRDDPTTFLGDSHAPEGAGQPAADDAGAVYAHTFAGFPPGFVGEVLEAAGCHPDESTTGALVTYARNGRPREISLIGGTEQDPGCLRGIRALAYTGVAPIGHVTRPDRRELVLFPMQKAFIDCAIEPTRPELPPIRAGAKLEEPQKTRNVSPVYPPSAREDHTEGLVVLSAVISTSGCVEQLEIVRTEDLRLAVAAVNAVAGWRYSPTRLDGQPVPTVMTVTVNFRLP